MAERVYCLYRVSTNKQVDHDENNQADIPMQRKAWVIVGEEQETGVSGYKVSADDRDKLQLIKKYAEQGKFDILLVFMFDRLGRKSDETPFVVEWFTKKGVRVWSVQEGEQRFESHTDRLTNYIRFWQAGRWREPENFDAHQNGPWPDGRGRPVPRWKRTIRVPAGKERHPQQAQT